MGRDASCDTWAELDAYYSYLYGLTRRELEYILDPKAVMGEDYPSETFRVLKEMRSKSSASTGPCALSLKRGTASLPMAPST